MVAKCFVRNSSNSNVEKKLSAAALSRADPTRLMDWVMPSRSHTPRNRPALYSPGSRGRRNAAVLCRS